MNKMLALALMVCQYTCNVIAIGLFVYLLRQAGSVAEVKVWLGPLMLIGLGAVFKLARRGAAAPPSGQEIR